MAGLGIDRLCLAAAAEVAHDAVGIAHGGIQLLCHLRHGDFIRAIAADDILQLLDGHGRQTASLGNFTDIRQRAGSNHHAAFRIQRADQIAIGIHHKGSACELGFLGGNLYIVHGMGHCGADAIGCGNREFQMAFQECADSAFPEFLRQKPQNPK